MKLCRLYMLFRLANETDSRNFYSVRILIRNEINRIDSNKIAISLFILISSGACNNSLKFLLNMRIFFFCQRILLRYTIDFLEKDNLWYVILQITFVCVGDRWFYESTCNLGDFPNLKMKLS